MEHVTEIKYKNAFCAERPAHGVEDDFSLRHPKMRLDRRAKIFSPFAALSGFEEAIDSKLEIYVPKAELSEEKQEKINAALLSLAGLMQAARHTGAAITVTVEFYVPCADENHEAYGRAGRYERLTGSLRKLDPVITRTIRVEDRVIEFSDISDIQIKAQTEEGE